MAGMQETTTAATRVPAARRAAPDPGIELPEVAVPTVLVAAASLALWLIATSLTVAVVQGRLGRGWLAVTIPALTLVTFSMFTVLHESVHHAAGRVSWVNACLGRLAMPFVAAWASFPMFTWLHIEHHRNTNEGPASDPDAWTEDAPTWQLPLRWLAFDLWYACFYLPRMRRRPAGEQLGVLATLTVVASAVVALVTTGHGTELVLAYLLPQRLGVGLLSWWFDWLPHHGLESTSRSDRFQATRVRVGWERVMSPLMFNQNYHLVHHIHPTIPFYRYVQAWRSTEADWLSRDVPIATAWGSSLTSQEYTAWRSLTASYDGRGSASHVGVTAAPYDGLAAGRSRLHALTVEAIRPLTAEAVAVTLEVPPGLAEAFAFRAGQHVTIRVVLDGHEVRRTYSVLSPEGSGVLTLGVKRVAGGTLSTYLTRELRAGDALDVGEPSGGFVLAPARGRARTLGAVAAGSGITPVLSLLATALAADPNTTATLVYANRSPATTMLADELAALAGWSAGRQAGFMSSTCTAPVRVPARPGWCWPGGSRLSGSRSWSTGPGCAMSTSGTCVDRLRSPRPSRRCSRTGAWRRRTCTGSCSSHPLPRGPTSGRLSYRRRSRSRWTVGRRRSRRPATSRCSRRRCVPASTRRTHARVGPVAPAGGCCAAGPCTYSRAGR